MDEKDVRYAKWLEGELSDDELIVKEGDTTLAELKKVIETVDNWSMPSYDTDAGFQKMNQRHLSPTTKVRKLQWQKITSIAATIVVLLACWFLFSKDSTKVLKADYGQNHSFAFSDRSQIWLNDGSSVEYNAKEWSNNRTVELTGEALFQVEKGIPFVVNTQHGSITVLGTKFNVRAWGENLYVECYEGSVQVIANNQTTVLTTNESVNVIGNDMKEKQPFVHTTPTWKNGASRFYDEQLSTICDELERQYKIEVDLTATDRRFSGNFRHDNLERALTNICKPLGLKYSISSDTKTVVIE